MRARMPGKALLLAGGVLVGVVAAMCLLSFLWTPHDPLATNAVGRYQPPSAEHWLGTDALGRDVTSLILVGSRVPLLVGAAAVTISFLIGVPWGITAGILDHEGRAAGSWMMRGNDVVQAFPPLLLAIVLAAVWGGSTWTAMVALGVGAAPAVARVVRSGALQVLSREFALASWGSGRGRLHLAWRHVLPNIRGILIVQATVGFAIAVLAEAALSFLGLGTPPPTPSWGRMLQDGPSAVHVQPLLLLWPGGAIAMTVLGLNLLGDGLRDRLDPRGLTRRAVTAT